MICIMPLGDAETEKKTGGAFVDAPVFCFVSIQFQLLGRGTPRLMSSFSFRGCIGWLFHSCLLPPLFFLTWAINRCLMKKKLVRPSFLFFKNKKRSRQPSPVSPPLGAYLQQFSFFFFFLVISNGVLIKNKIETLQFHCEKPKVK